MPLDLVPFVSGLLAAHRAAIGTRKNTRRLGCYRQALFGLAWYRDRDRASIARLGAGFGLSQATAYRYLDEVTSVLAERHPDCARRWSGRWPRAPRTSSWTAP